MPANPTVFVIDDDCAIRDFLSWLISQENMDVKTFSSAHDFIEANHLTDPGCLLLDIRMPKMNGSELQKWLKVNDSILPIIMITGHGDVPLAVESMKAGAFDFFEKPFDTRRLLDCIKAAISFNAEQRNVRKNTVEVTKRLDLMTPRERQVYDMLVLGKTNKTIAARLNISDRTVEIHRSRVMRKMSARSIADLIQYNKTL